MKREEEAVSATRRQKGLLSTDLEIHQMKNIRRRLFELRQLSQWVAEHKVVNKRGLTAEFILAHAKKRYPEASENMNLQNMRDLLDYEGFDFVELKNASGYYRARSSLPSAIHHRKKLCPVLEHLWENPNLYDVWFQDESPFRAHISKVFSWVTRWEEDARMNSDYQPGSGEGFGMSAFWSPDVGIAIDDDGDIVGYVKETTKKGSRATVRHARASDSVLVKQPLNLGDDVAEAVGYNDLREVEDDASNMEEAIKLFQIGGVLDDE